MAKKNLSPFPNIGEIIRALSRALDIKQKNKRLDSYARCEIYDYSLKEELINEIIFEPLYKNISKNFAKFVKDELDNFLNLYLIEIVKKIPLSMLKREEVLPVLNCIIFSYNASNFISKFHNEFNGPAPTFLVSSNEKSSIDATFQWFEKNIENWENFIKGMEKNHRDKINRWKKGIELPSFKSIIEFHDWSDFKFPETNKNKIERIKSVLILSRTIDYFKKINFGEQAVSELRLHIWAYYTPYEMDKKLNTLIKSAENQFDKEYLSTINELFELLNSKTEKRNELQAIIKYKLLYLEEIKKKFDPEDRLLYLHKWLNGKYFVFSREDEKALNFYKEAVSSSFYSAGLNQIKIMEESLVLAAKLNKRPFLKMLKNYMISFGLFMPVNPDYTSDKSNAKSRSKGIEVEDFEVADWAANFYKYFPSSNFFVKEKNENDTINSTKPYIIVSEVDHNFRPDTKHPDRIIKIGSKLKQMPQLNWFIEQGKHIEVKKLIKAGASVNVFSEANESPVLIAIQMVRPDEFINNFKYNYKSLDILMKKIHHADTLNKRTNKKKMTPLTSAVYTGKPNIVKWLLKQGADPDFRGKTDNQTPLNIALKRIAFLSNPKKYKENCNNLNPMAPELLEYLRRTDGGFHGIHLEDQKRRLNNRYNNPRSSHIKEIPENHSRANLLRYLNIKDFYKIVELLLKAGADPNAEHTDPIPGYTPLMVAAEIDNLEIFKKMVDKGGDVNKTYSFKKGNIVFNLNCMDIAREFKSRKIFSFIKNL
ncbi:MAG: ankyrin repeat domain-containing protein [Desulfobacteraceae bacterium]|jgi:ankyrin repeat protein